MNSQSLQSVVLVGLPYAAIAAFVAGLIRRYRSRFTISSLSSQILESRWLVWGSVPFHLGIVLLFLGHFIPFLLPLQWQSLVSNRSALLSVESIGRASAILCLIGLVVLFVRRVSTPAVRATSTLTDLFVLAILIAQVVMGFGLATMYRWGSVWSATTTTPYLWSVLTLHPDPSLVAAVPLLVALHIATAWIVLALVPFTRLVHMLTLPLGYLARSPQKVVWATSRRRPKEQKQTSIAGTPPRPARHLTAHPATRTAR